jgi:hypothetical protein
MTYARLLWVADEGRNVATAYDGKEVKYTISEDLHGPALLSETGGNLYVERRSAPSSLGRLKHASVTSEGSAQTPMDTSSFLSGTRTRRSLFIKGTASNSSPSQISSIRLRLWRQQSVTT